MDDDDKAETILTNLRAALADFLSDDLTRTRFLETVAAYCKRLTKGDDAGALSCAIEAMMEHGPRDLDEAYVLLGALHDSGPHGGGAEQALLGDWHSIIDHLGMLTPDAVHHLPAWFEKVKADCPLPLLNESPIYPLIYHRGEAEDANRIEDYAQATPAALLAHCNRMIERMAGFNTFFLMSPAEAGRMACDLDDAWFDRFNRDHEMLCLAAIPRGVDLEPFKELAKSVYSFWRGVLPAQDTKNAIERLNEPCISALFNLKRVLMVEVATPPASNNSQEMTLSEVALKYDVGLPTLSKATRLPEKDLNHLPARKDGRNVYVKAKDADVWCKNYIARREARQVAEPKNADKPAMKDMLKRLGRGTPKKRGN